MFRGNKAVLLLLILFLTILGIVQNRTVEPASAQSNRPAAASLATTAEYWKMGVTLENTRVYSAVAGRLLTESASFRSAKASDIYFVFPAAADERTIQSVRYLLLGRSGSYGAASSLTLEIFDLEGNLLRTASAAPLNLTTPSLNTWGSLALSANAANLTLQPGEFLAFHCNFSGGAGGDLAIYPVFEIEVQE
jgi:hypothetical protein